MSVDLIGPLKRLLEPDGSSFTFLVEEGSRKAETAITGFFLNSFSFFEARREDANLQVETNKRWREARVVCVCFAWECGSSCSRVTGQGASWCIIPRVVIIKADAIIAGVETDSALTPLADREPQCRVLFLDCCSRVRLKANLEEEKKSHAGLRFAIRCKETDSQTACPRGSYWSSLILQKQHDCSLPGN